MKIAIWVFLLSLSVHAKDFGGRYVSVSGNCLKTMSADRGSVMVTVMTLDLSLKKSTADATKQYNDLREEIKKLNLKDLLLSTSEYSVGEESNWENNKSIFKGFRTRFGLRVETPEIQRLGEVIDVASKLGVKNVGSLSTFISDEKMKSESESCLEIAVKNAKEKASKMAQALGSSIGEVLAISENRHEVPEPPVFRESLMRVKSMDVPSMSPPTIEANNSKLNLNVDVTFGLK